MDGSVDLMLAESPLSTNIGHARAYQTADRSQVHAFRERKCILYVDAEVAHGYVEFGLTEQYLESPYVARLTVDQGNLGAAERVRSIAGPLDADLLKPSLEQSRIVACRKAVAIMPTGGEQEFDSPDPALAYPSEYAVARALRHLEAGVPVFC